MKLFPAMRANQGSWEYFVVKMHMRELVNEVLPAHEIYDDSALNEELLQGLIQEPVKRKFVECMEIGEEVFINPVVVLSLGGNPRFSSISIREDLEFELFDQKELNETFGIISFNGKQRFYVLEGQHRVFEMKRIVEQEEMRGFDADKETEAEEIPVILLVTRTLDDAVVKKLVETCSSINKLAALAQVVEEFLESSDQPSELTGTGGENKVASLNLAWNQKP